MKFQVRRNEIRVSGINTLIIFDSNKLPKVGQTPGKTLLELRS